MIIYIDNKHVDNLERFVKREMLKEDCQCLDAEREAVSKMLKSIEEEKSRAPYVLWERDQKNLSPNQKNKPSPKKARATRVKK